jgi:hypothetical protein
MIWKVPARSGVPLKTAFVGLKERPGGTPDAERPVAELVPATVKLKGTPRKPYALSALGYTMDAALFGYKRLVGIICFAWLGLYHESDALALLLP